MKIRIDLTKKDADIAAFKKSLPKGEWSKNVVQIMNAAMRDRVADIPMQFTIEALDEKYPRKYRSPRSWRRDFAKSSGAKKATFPPVSKSRSASASERTQNFRP